MKKVDSLRCGQTKIRISKITLNKIRVLCNETGFAQITVLEYLLNGNIPLDRLK